MWERLKGLGNKHVLNAHIDNGRTEIHKLVQEIMKLEQINFKTKLEENSSWNKIIYLSGLNSRLTSKRKFNELEKRYEENT